MGAKTGLNLKERRGEVHYKGFIVLLSSFLVAFITAGILAPVESSNALTCISGSTGTDGEICSTAGTDVSVTIDNPYYITIANTLTKVDLDYSTSDTNLGHILTTMDTITTTSNTGQTKYLYISTTHDSTTAYANNLINDNTDLTNNKTYIKAGGGNTLDTATSLTDNTWGFSIDNLKEANVFTKVPVLGNELLLQEEVGTETIDEDTKAGTGEYVSTKDVYYGVLATTDLYAGKYSNTIKYTAFTTEPPDMPQTIEDITYMHEMSGDICNNTGEGVTTTLKDIRGSYTDPNTPAEYGVIKAKDGNCWMTDNLNLYGMTVPAEYSDFESGTYEIPESTNWGNNAYSEPKVHRATTSGYTDQVYYNWCSAVAMINCATASEQNQSICPKNWMLPKGGTSADDIATDASWPKLVNTYKALNGGTLTGANLTTTDTSAVVYPLGFRLYYGYWAYTTRVEGQGEREGGWFWSSKPSNTAIAYRLQYNSGSVTTYSISDKGYGMSVRCVSRD